VALVGKFKKNRNKGKKKEPKLKEGEMTFLDHLEELRWHLIRSFAAIVIIGIAIFIYRKWVVDEVILGLLGAEFPTNQLLCFLRGLDGEACAKAVEASLIALSPQEQFLKTIEISLIGGFIVAFPYIIWEFWRFIKPGLHKHEARAVRGNVAVMSMLFFIGVAFGYYIISPFSIQFFSSFTISDDIVNTWRIGKVISLVMQIVLGAGIIFEMPILMYYLAKMGVITPDILKAYRRHAIVILLLMAAVITPPDIMSQVLIFIPLFLLYEVSVRIVKRVHKKREKELAASLGPSVTS